MTYQLDKIVCARIPLTVIRSETKQYLSHNMSVLTLGINPFRMTTITVIHTNTGDDCASPYDTVLYYCTEYIQNY